MLLAFIYCAFLLLSAEFILGLFDSVRTASPRLPGPDCEPIFPVGGGEGVGVGGCSPLDQTVVVVHWDPQGGRRGSAVPDWLL